MTSSEFLEMFNLTEPVTPDDFKNGLYVIGGNYGSVDVAMQQMYRYVDYYPESFRAFASKLGISNKQSCDKVFKAIQSKSRKQSNADKKRAGIGASHEIMWDYLKSQAM